jgi:hypothetical protein
METTSCGGEMVVRQNDEWGFRCGELTNPKNVKGKFIFDSVPPLGRNPHFGFCPQAFAPITLHTAGKVCVAA